MEILSLMHEPSSMWSTEDNIVFPVRSYKHDKHTRKQHNRIAKQLLFELMRCLPAFYRGLEEKSRSSPENPK